jgi:CHAT domain-containing protein
VFSGQEVQAVTEVTGGVLLEGTRATAGAVKETMDGARYVHFACHGLPDTEMPLDGGLLLAPDIAPDGGSADRTGALTLAEILQSVRLARDSLVVLSACETGLVKVEERHEEYLGLPAGFLCAGAATVVSSLWKVNDVASWLFMRVFAREVTASGSPLAALRSAQRELRELPRERVLEQVACAAAAEIDPSRREQMRAIGHWFENAAPFPFAGPYWWAGFTVNGLV